MAKSRTQLKKVTAPAGPAKSVRGTGSSTARAARFFDLLLPETELPSGTNYSDRQAKRTALQDFRRTLTRAEGTFERIDEALDAEEADRERRLEADDAGARDRRELDLWVRENEEARTNLRLTLEIGERLLVSRDTSRVRTLFMVLTAISVLATIGLAYLGALRGEPLYDGGSIVGALLSAGGIFTLRFLTSSGRRGHGGEADPVDLPADGREEPRPAG